jgi:hypothetical protein
MLAFVRLGQGRELTIIPQVRSFGWPRGRHVEPRHKGRFRWFRSLFRWRVNLRPILCAAASHNILESRRCKCVIGEITEVLPRPMLRTRWGMTALAQSGTLHS